MDKPELNEEASLFKGMQDKAPVPVTMEELHRLITGDSLHDSTEKFRYFTSVGLHTDADKEKRKALCFTPSVTCKGGHGKKHVTAYTGRCMVDFDDQPMEKLLHALELLADDPYVVLAYITISNAGLRIIYRTDVTDITCHPYAYAQGNEHYARLLSFNADPKCKDATRCSVLCEHKDAYFNPEAERMHIEIPSEEEKTKKKPGRPRKIHSTEARLAEPAVLDILAQQGKVYAEGRYNEYVSCALYLMNGFGVPEEDACDWAVNHFEDYNSSVIASICHSVYQHTEEHGSRPLPHPSRKRKENPEFNYATIEELEDFINTQTEVRINVFNHRREICMAEETRFRPLTDSDENTLWLRAQKKGLYTSYRIFASILNSEFIGNYHPFHTYVEGLSKWDGVTDYISQVADLVETTDRRYFQHVFKKWFVAYVASNLVPEVINHEILTLIGEEGVYKTTFIKKLIPPELQRYFCPKVSTGAFTKDDLLEIAESLIICLEEIDSMSMSKMNRIKASVTLPEVNTRAAYAHNREYLSHCSSFCATGNNRYYLPDGYNRRWLSIYVLNINASALDSLPYDGMYAQAWSLYSSGFCYWFEGDEAQDVKEHNEWFKEPSIEEELVLEHYRLPLPGEKPVLLSVTRIMTTVSLGTKYVLSHTKTRQALEKFGFRQARTKKLRGFLVIELTNKEIAENQRYIPSKEETDGPDIFF